MITDRIGLHSVLLPLLIIIIIIIIIIISSRTKIVLVGQWLWCRQIARKSDDE